MTKQDTWSRCSLSTQRCAKSSTPFSKNPGSLRSLLCKEIMDHLTVADQQTAVEQVMHILNAYYLPGGGSSALYDTITPANSFRVVFNYYFQAGLPLLEDKCYFSTF